MAAFSAIYGEVVEQLHDSSADMVTRAKEWVNLAQQEVATAIEWPWLLTENQVIIDDAITDGTAHVINGDETVDFSTEILPATMAVGQWYFQAGTDTVWYPVSTKTDADTFELLAKYQGDTDETTTYKLYHIIYSMPSDLWRVADNRNMASPLKMNYASYLRVDFADPALQQTGTDSFLWIPMGVDASGYMEVMFWPPRITAGSFNIRYYKLLSDLSDVGELDDVSQIPLPDHEILVFGALMRGFRYLADPEQVQGNSFEFFRRLDNMKKRYLTQPDGTIIMGSGQRVNRDLLSQMSLPVVAP